MRLDAKEGASLVSEIASAACGLGDVKLMEVCGTHTMAIARAGIKALLPPNVTLLSGPGCPVCVTPASSIDALLKLSERGDVTIATYGDMLGVPGSVRGDTLKARRARGASAVAVYSPVDAVTLAADDSSKKVVFAAVGFETTAPGTAAAVELARARGVANFFAYSMHKRVAPGLRALLDTPGFAVRGFLCPGHVASVTGASSFGFLPDEYGAAAVVSGFEPLDILRSILMLLEQLRHGRPALENEYGRAVSRDGNALALAAIERVFEPEDAYWRGLGLISGGGLRFRPEFAAFDAEAEFKLPRAVPDVQTGCACGEVLRGAIFPGECPLFGKVCTPDDPVGPCMVSGEGACAAEWIKL